MSDRVPDIGGPCQIGYLTLVVHVGSGTSDWWSMSDRVHDTGGPCRIGYLTLVVHVEDPLSARDHLPVGPPLLLPEFPFRSFILHLAEGPEATGGNSSLRWGILKKCNISVLWIRDILVRIRRIRTSD